MKKIRIKVKHLVYMIMCITVLFMFILPNALFIYAEAMEKGDIETSKVYYKKYIEMFPFGSKRAEALYNLAGSIIPGDSNSLRYKIFSNGSSTLGKVITEQMVDNAVSYYKEIIEKYKSSKYYEKSYTRLLNVLIMGGRFTEAEKIIAEGLTSNNENIKLAALKFKIQDLIIGRQYEEAAKLGENLINEGKADSDIYMLLGDINFYSRNLDDARIYYKKAEEGWTYSSVKKDTRIMESNLGIHPSQKIELVDKMKNGYTGSSEIHGNVTINGNPAPFVYVYLKNENDSGFNGIGDEERHINALTDYSGNFIIPSLPKGTYEIGIGVPGPYLENTVFQTSNTGYIHLDEGESKNFDFTFVPPIKLINPDGNTIPRNNKVELEWENVKDAAYYLVRFITFEKPGTMEGNNAALAVHGNITGNRFTLDIDKANMVYSGFMMDEQGMVNPQAYLGSFYPGSHVPIFVEAFSSDGKLITSTRPIIGNISDMAVIDVPDDNLSEGDKLILGQKPEEAVTAYEKALKKNPGDIHSMMVLSKLYTLGTKRKYKQGEGEISEGTNVKRAHELLEKLYELTGKNNYLKAQFSVFILEPQDYKDAVERYTAIPENELDEEDFMRIAELCLAIKDYDKAGRYFEKIYELKKSTNYYDLAPVLLKIYNGDADGSLRFLKILDLRSYNIDKDKLYSDINKLNNVDKTTPEYKKFLDAIKILLSSRYDRKYKDNFKNIYGSIRNPLLSEILKNAGSYYFVFSTY